MSEFGLGARQATGSHIVCSAFPPGVRTGGPLSVYSKRPQLMTRCFCRLILAVQTEPQLIQHSLVEQDVTCVYKQ